MKIDYKAVIDAIDNEMSQSLELSCYHEVRNSLLNVKLCVAELVLSAVDKACMTAGAIVEESINYVKKQ